MNCRPKSGTLKPMKKPPPRPKKIRLFEVVVTHDPKERGPYKYTVDVPALPGCFSEGRTREEALRNVREAIELVLDVRARRVRKETELVEVSC